MMANDSFQPDIGLHSNDLRLAFKKYGSDKSTGHNYHVPYSRLIPSAPAGPLLEIGIGTNFLDVASTMGTSGVPGASLRAWREVGVFTGIYGADIDHRILFDEPGIECHHVDQLDSDSLGRLRDELSRGSEPRFSFIVDDGLHTLQANVNSFETLFPLLKPRGIYAIEDVHKDELSDLITHIVGNGIHAWGLWSDLTRGDDNQIVFARRLPTS